MKHTARTQTLILGLAASLLVAGCAAKEAAKTGTYATPEEAVKALDSVLGSHDTAKIEEVFGPGSAEVLQSGDAEEDTRLSAMVKEMIAQKVSIEEVDENTRVAFLGDKIWPFPVPIVRDGEGWKFDTAAGREELLNRRIGYYELSTLSSLHAYVDAQREYAAESRDGQPAGFAQRFNSQDGKHDGLYWPTAEGEPLSPLGDLLAGAAVPPPGGEPKPFHGYNYRILKGQGKSAPGGEKSYLDDKGLMTGGFAAIAWPAKYGNSGVMTFIVNNQGIVFEKDLGEQTETLAPAIEAYDPDSSWSPTADTLAEVPDLDEPADEAESGESAQ